MTRSELMSRIKSVSRMEILAKRLCEEKAGCRLKHQPKGVFGRPDYANKRRKVAVFVHGCFWHACPWHGTMPKTNREFWENKFRCNRNRDAFSRAHLRRKGWTVVTVWEHEAKRKRRP